MRPTTQVPLDPDSQRLLERLARDLGWSPSRVLQEALWLLAACYGQSRRKIAGMGKFRSGVHDLGSNKAHLKNFGR
jgi:hypothetical protein